MTITLTREEAQQVLDALDSCEWYDDGGFGCPSYDYDKVSPARETLRARLSAPEQEQTRSEKMREAGITRRPKRWSKEDEPEPVAWLFQHEETGLTDCIDTQQVEWGFEKNNPRWQKIAPLYIAPPQREWQGLTAYEIQELHLANPNWGNFACAIEAKLKEKNNG